MSLKKLSEKAKEASTPIDVKGLKASAFEAFGQAFVLCSSDLNIIDTNEAFTSLSGYEEPEVIGTDVRKLSSDKNNPGLHTEIKNKVARYGKWQGEFWCRHKDGTECPVWLAVGTIEADQGTYYFGTALDITALKQREMRLEHMAQHDMLTSLPNRSLMMDRLRQSLSMAKRYQTMVGVMLIDLDRFKEINDTLGHHVGDQLLIEVAARLINAVRESDTVSRLGGDEFLLVLPEVGTPTNAAHVAQKLLEALARPFYLEGHDYFISGSIGISIYPADGADADSLVKHADTAMYHAKAQGKNNFKFFTEDINKSTIERFMLETRFRRALEKLEFQLNYQAKIDLRTDCVAGMEALLRWFHPEQGNVRPGLFIPLAEETGFVVQLGEWAIREACRQNKAWQDEGMQPIRVSVNLSARQFLKKDLTAMVSDILTETALDPQYLMLEITESTIIQDIEETIHILEEFKAMGVGVSIDDFGTGYSSLSYLNRFPIDELKIDSAFVADIVTRADNLKVITAIVALAHSLNLKVVAEGVETIEQLQVLRTTQCDEVQGYFFSRPLSSEDFRAFIKRGCIPKD